MPKKKNTTAKDPGLGFSPYRQSVRMTQGPDDRLREKRARRAGKVDRRGIEKE